ncbi:MAG: hypothetical protein IJU87_08215 [Lachnospiraceae bacterium]|nr:hypothetical protein [Lachnospiraceae bacterium]
MKRTGLPALLLSILLIIPVLTGCGKSSAAADAGDPNEGRGDLITEEPQSEETKEKEPEEGSEEQPEEEKPADGAGAENTLVIKGATYTGLSNLRNDNNEDGTYFYEDMTEDSMTLITNMCAPASSGEDRDPAAYAESFVSAEVDSDALVTETKEDTKLSAAFSYPVYRVSWTSGSNEDTKQAEGVVVLTDSFTFYYGFRCPIDEYDSNAAFYEGELDGLELMDFGEAASDTASDTGEGGGAYEALYLGKVNELSSEGLADRFGLYHIDNDDIPELIAADSNGSFDHDNAFIFSVFDGKVVQLAGGISGVDGTSISFSEKKNLIRETSGMAGATEIFSEIKDGALSEVFKAEMINTLQTDEDDNEIFSYSVNGKETDEAAYYKELAGFVADYDPMMRVDFDGLKVITYKSGDGSGYFEETETEAYQSLEEITGLLQ